MTSAHISSDKTEHSYATTLDALKARNGLAVDVVRVVGVAIFFASFAAGFRPLGDTMSPTMFGLTDLYLALAIGVLLASLRSPKAARLSGYAIPLIDVPLATLIQLERLSTAADPSELVSFYLSSAVLMLAACALLFSRRLMVLTAAAAIVSQYLLRATVGQDLMLWVNGTFILLVAAVIAILGARRQLALMRQVAEEVEGRRELESQAMLLDRMATLGTLAASVAHEINNPLAVIQCGVDYLAADRPGDTQEERAEVLADVAAGTKQLRAVVQDLKLLSRKETDEMRSIDLAEVVTSALRLAAPQLKKRAQVIPELSAAPAVMANDARLTQVLTNLLINASHAIPEGAASKNRITVRVKTGADGAAVLEVEDTGTGMSSEVKARLFEPFFTTKPKGIGTGLGLPICRRIVTALKGTIEVDSELGRGTTFRITLPAIA